MDGFCLLMEVITGGDDIRGVTRLIEEGVDVNHRTSAGATILHYSALYARPGVIGCLVGHGAVINARDVNGMTPLHYTLAEDTADILKKRIIVERWRGRFIEWDEDMTFLLQNLVEERQIQLLDCLVRLGADINARYGMNATSLGLAVQLRIRTKKKKVKVVRMLAELGLVRICEPRTRGLTALLLAIEQGKKEAMKYLVRNGADVQAACSIVPLLHEAVQCGCTEIVSILLENGADTNALKYDNITPVYRAVEHHSTDLGIFTCLANLGADFNSQCVITRAVHEAVSRESLGMLACLLDHIPHVQSPNIDHIIKQPAIVGVDASDLQLLEQLVVCGTDTNTKFDNTISTLVQASRIGNIHVVRQLVVRGFKVDTAKVFVGVTAFQFYLLQKSAMVTHENISSILRSMKLLIDHGADVNATLDHRNVLHDAVARGEVDMVIILQRCGANMNTIGHRKSSILNECMNETRIRACEFDNDIMKFLLAAGADFSAGYEVIPPLISAVEQSDAMMVCALLQLGASVHQPMVKGVTPFHHACCLDTNDMLEYLLQHGADPNMEYEEGIEPILEAIRLGNADMASLLLEFGADPCVGKEYMRWNATRAAIDSGDGKVLRCLIRGGVDLSPQLAQGASEYLDQGSMELAESLEVNIHSKPRLPTTLLAAAIKRCGDLDIIETILNSNSYPNPRSKPPVTQSDLQGACYFGFLDIVRLMIFDGCDTNEQDADGRVAFDALPLVSYADYHTLFETRHVENTIVADRPGVEYEPSLACLPMNSMLSCPGLGDVQFIQHPRSKEVHEEVHKAVCEIAERFQIFPGVRIKVRPCGSSAEGTKTGFSDEMDFLVDVGKAHPRDIGPAGHDYVYYSAPIKSLDFEGSKMFHFNVFNKLRQYVRHHSRSRNGEVTISGFFVSDAVNEANRRATTPMTMYWRHQQSPVSVDFVPGLHVEGWPDGAIQNTWLLTYEELRQHGYYIVPKPPHVQSDLAKEYTPQQQQILWKVSFPHLETYHMQHLEQRVKDVYVLAKCLRNPDVCRIMVTDEGSLPKRVDKFVTSYMLKMVLFKNVDEFRSSDLTLGEMVCRVYDQVAEGLATKGFIPLYFMPEVSALAGHKLDISKCARVAKLMKKFVHGLYLRDCRRDPTVTADVEEVVVYQRKPSTVYRSVEVGR